MGRINKRKKPFLFDILSGGRKSEKIKSKIPASAQTLVNAYLDFLRSNPSIKEDLELSLITQKFHEKSVEQVRSALSKYTDERRIEILQNSISDGVYYLTYSVMEALVIVNSGSFTMFLAGGSDGLPVIVAQADNTTVRHVTGDNEMVNETANAVISALWYKQNAGLEIKTIPGQSRKKAFNCAYKNESPVPIDILDANWYTTIIRVKPVIRSAHKRKQWYGKGRTKFKIIDVPEMLINGYTRRAKIAKGER